MSAAEQPTDASAARVIAYLYTLKDRLNLTPRDESEADHAA